MAVEWIADTINSILKTKYDDSSSKISDIRSQLESNDCDTSLADELQEKLDDTVNKSLGSVSSMAEKITNVTNCVSAVAPDVKDKAMNGMADTMNKVLSGVPLDNIISQLDDILDDIANKTCDEINDAISDAQDSVNDIADKVVNAAASVEVTVQLEINVSQNLAKAAGLINCISESLSNDGTGLADHLEMMHPELKGVATAIKDGLNAGKDGQTLLFESKAKISENLGTDNKYDDLVNAVSDLF